MQQGSKIAQTRQGHLQPHAGSDPERSARAPVASAGCDGELSRPQRPIRLSP